MKAPKIIDSLSWGKQKSQAVAAEGAGVFSAAASGLNKFANDGNFMNEYIHKQSRGSDGSVERNVESEKDSLETNKPVESSAVFKDKSSANQLAAKAFQLRLKGMHEEADKLLQEVNNINTKQAIKDPANELRTQGISSRTHLLSRRMQKMMQTCILLTISWRTSSKAFLLAHDFEDDQSRRKGRKKQGTDDYRITQKNTQPNRFLTKQERCLFCLENPSQSIHLFVSLANYTYLMLPQWQPVVPGLCCILATQLSLIFTSSVI